MFIYDVTCYDVTFFSLCLNKAMRQTFSQKHVEYFRARLVLYDCFVFGLNLMSKMNKNK